MTKCAWIATILIALSLTANAASQAGTVLLDVRFTPNGSTTVQNVTYNPEHANTVLPFMGAGNYTLKIFNTTKDTALSKAFSVPFTRYVIKENGQRVPAGKSPVTVQLQIALPQAARLIYIQQANETIAQVNLAEQLCNQNTACEPDFGESKYVCPADCLETEPIVCGNTDCESGENATNCPQDCGAQTTATTALPWWVYVGIGAVLVGLALALVLIKSRSHR